MTILENEPMTASTIIVGTEYGQTVTVHVSPDSLNRRTDDPSLLSFDGTATLFVEQCGGYENGKILLGIQTEENGPTHIFGTAHMTFMWDKENERIELVPLSEVDVLQE